MPMMPRTRNLPEQTAHRVRSPEAKVPSSPAQGPPPCLRTCLLQPTSLLLSLLPALLLNTYCIRGFESLWGLDLGWGLLSRHPSSSHPSTHPPLSNPASLPRHTAGPQKVELWASMCVEHSGPSAESRHPNLLQTPLTSSGNGYSCPDRPQGESLPRAGS